MLMTGCSFGAHSSVETTAEVAAKEATGESERAGSLEVEGRASPPPILMEKTRPKGAVVFPLASMSVPPAMVKSPLVAPVVTTPPGTYPGHPRENAGGPLFLYKGVWLGGSQGAGGTVGSRR